MSTAVLRELTESFSLLKTPEERERFLTVVGALTLRVISLEKASELMGMSKEAFLGLLEATGIDFSYLDGEDGEIERSWT